MVTTVKAHPVVVAVATILSSVCSSNGEQARMLSGGVSTAESIRPLEPLRYWRLWIESFVWGRREKRKLKGSALI